MAGDKEALNQLLDGQLSELLKIMEARDVEELELEVSGLKVRLRRLVGEHLDAIPIQEPAEPSEAGSAGDFVLAQRVGFFHSSSGDGADAPKVGDEVAEGQVLGAIDSLSVPVPVQAPRPGRLEEVLVEDGQPVEYGQPLFVVR